MRIAVALVLLGLLAPGPAHAQRPEGEPPATFTSDRPGFANTPGVAARGRLTTELGLALVLAEQETELFLPTLSLRTGLFEFLEARVLALGGRARFPSDGGDRWGVGDVIVGFKIGGPLDDVVALSSVWSVRLPTGSDGFRALGTELRADLNVAWAFWGPLSLTPNAVVEVLVEDDAGGARRRVVALLGSLKLSWQLLPVLGLFVQSFARYEEAADDVRVQVGGGIFWMAAPNWQLDAEFNSRVTDQGSLAILSLGTTVLW
ncbi:MAG: transporter [Sandaracinaceae bacterium]